MVPMVNIDGVQLGNFRCDIFGNDMNRTWAKGYYPVVQQIKKLLREENIRYFFDLHGHSRKRNAFLYGCRREK